MSKESIGRDRWRQLGQSDYTQGGWCPGCGYYAIVNNGEHRADCTRGLHHQATEDAFT